MSSILTYSEYGFIIFVIKHDKEGEQVNILQRRKTLGLTQAQLAEKVGVTRSAVAMWETGAGNPRFQTLPVLAEALGCTVDELVRSEVTTE